MTFGLGWYSNIQSRLEARQVPNSEEEITHPEDSSDCGALHRKSAPLLPFTVTDFVALLISLRSVHVHISTVMWNFENCLLRVNWDNHHARMFQLCEVTGNEIRIVE